MVTHIYIYIQFFLSWAIRAERSWNGRLWVQEKDRLRERFKSNSYFATVQVKWWLDKHAIEFLLVLVGCSAFHDVYVLISFSSALAWSSFACSSWLSPICLPAITYFSYLLLLSTLPHKHQTCSLPSSFSFSYSMNGLVGSFPYSLGRGN